MTNETTRTTEARAKGPKENRQRRMRALQDRLRDRGSQPGQQKPGGAARVEKAGEKAGD